ncbi:Sec-independent protein translocase subunit TatA [Corynebacterium liangguodongii]|uniref:Sec-independent protein translocase protein TatA n=1 Tax=Corynebacterium liangguodongii TaxID=2079535 RepID=A0A2S0WE05_9CORY|nr:Sec-independent protein translocase subunit TatA [Corynebacterium liangguodongii]AWB83999.1 twin-arginine translocase TatA/TatE family subunit [Corynebacterium liangguodongii]PWC00011.1 twin-arginine translocase TatA/TatE family subunit [Corynebacterium liangguodongii]
MTFPSGTEFLIILAIILLLFGANKLPDLARSVGRSARIFKSEVKELHNDGEPQQAPEAPETQSVRTEPAQPAQPVQPVQPAAQDSFWDRPENQPRPQN